MGTDGAILDMPQEYLPEILLGFIIAQGHIWMDKNDHLFLRMFSQNRNLLNKLQSKIHMATGLPRKKSKIKPVPIYVLGQTKSVGLSYAQPYQINYKDAVALDLLTYIFTSSMTQTVNALDSYDRLNLLKQYNNALTSDVVKRRYDKSTHPRHNTLPKPVFEID